MSFGDRNEPSCTSEDLFYAKYRLWTERSCTLLVVMVLRRLEDSYLQC